MAATRTIPDLPGPPGLPLLGNALQVRPERLHLIGEEWCRRYGPVFRFRIGRRAFVGIGDAETINQILRDRPDGFRRWREVLQNAEEMTGSSGVFAAEGEDWRHQRRLAVTALNSNHLQRYFQIIATCTERLHRRLQTEARSGRPFEIGEALSSFTVDVTSSLAFGHDLNTLERGEVELQAHLHRVFEMSSRRLVAPVPYWRWLKLPADRELDRSLAAVRMAVNSFMEETRERIAARPELRDSPENFLEGMIAAQEKDGTFSDGEIFGNVFTLLLAGEDTTSHTMAWTIWLLATRPGVQAKWAQEASEVLGGECFPTEYEVVEGLRYGEAVVRESMRLKAVAPVSGIEPLADTEVAGVRIPAGTRLLLLNRLAGLRAVPRSEEFDPERWLEDEGEAPDQKAFLAFGAGPRFCPGRNLAFLEAKTALAMIARNFELELDPTAAPVTELFGFTMSPRGLRVRLRERTPALAAASWGRVKFEKWQALGNDYLIIEAEDLPWPLSPPRVRWLCDPHFGIGADGVLLLDRSEDPQFVADLRIFNPDGSEAELSGNGAREAILYLRRHGWTDEDSFAIHTVAGPIVPTILSELTCAVEMGTASTSSKDFPEGPEDGAGVLSAGGREWAFQHVSIGNPQCAIDVGEQLEDLDLEQIGPEIEANELFPNRTNVSFIQIKGSRVRARIFERGVGETLSSGTGASGAAITAFLRGAESPITVELDGGELEVEISEQLAVRLTGWAEPVYAGEASPELLEALAAQD